MTIGTGIAVAAAILGPCVVVIWLMVLVFMARMK